MRKNNVIISAEDVVKYKELISHFQREILEDFDSAVTDAVIRAIEKYSSDTSITFVCDGDDVEYLLNIVKAAGYTIPIHDYTAIARKLTLTLRFDKPGKSVRLNPLSISARSASESLKTRIGKRINSIIRNTFNPKVIEAAKRGRNEVHMEFLCYEVPVCKELQKIMESNGYIVSSGIDMFENRIEMRIVWLTRWND